MDWQTARRLVPFGSRARAANEDRGPSAGATPSPDRAGSICVVSGKGGTGKSIVSAALGALYADRGPTLIVDVDLGVGNAHILQDVSPRQSFVEIIERSARLTDVRVSCRPGLDLVSGGSGVSRMASLKPFELAMLAEEIATVEHEYATMLFDSAAGISEQTVAFATASDVVLLVTTPDVTAMTDAYAFLKVLLRRRPDAAVRLLVNRVVDGFEGRRVAVRMADVAQKFLGAPLPCVGFLPDDRAAVRSIAARRPVVVTEPSAAISMALDDVASKLAGELRAQPRIGAGTRLATTMRTIWGR